MISLDTNILVYATDKRGAGAQYLLARRIVDAARDVSIALTEQALIEFIDVAVRKTGLSLTAVTPYLDAFRRDFPLLLPSEGTVTEVINLLAGYNLSVWDAHLVAVCSMHGCEYLLSEDLQDGAAYGTVQVLNPFRPSNKPTLNALLTP